MGIKTQFLWDTEFERNHMDVVLCDLNTGIVKYPNVSTKTGRRQGLPEPLRRNLLAQIESSLPAYSMSKKRRRSVSSAKATCGPFPRSNLPQLRRDCTKEDSIRVAGGGYDEKWIDHVRIAVLRMWASKEQNCILQSYRVFLRPYEANKATLSGFMHGFDSELFLGVVPYGAVPFVSALMKTQLFLSFIEDACDMQSGTGQVKHEDLRFFEKCLMALDNAAIGSLVAHELSANKNNNLIVSTSKIHEENIASLMQGKASIAYSSFPRLDPLVLAEEGAIVNKKRPISRRIGSKGLSTDFMSESMSFSPTNQDRRIYSPPTPGVYRNLKGMTPISFFARCFNFEVFSRPNRGYSRNPTSRMSMW